MAKIVIDGVSYEVNPDNNLLQECLSQGLDLPYFCWHPCMGSVGACRQCAVKQYRNEEDKDGTLVMACMTPASDGAIISIKDDSAKSFRSSVIESLMISHPHDCPVCEEGGECHLQDMTLMSGHNYRRYDKKKVTHHNQYLGPFINHEMNRCITCYRCVRYYDDYAGGTDLSAQASHHHTYFGRHEDGVLESEFSGNLVEVCPTGVFTDKSFSENYTRKWDLQVAPSICTGCSVGCNTTPGERYGSVRRIVNRYNSEVNGYFLCDRGRFGFDYVNNGDRLKEAVKQTDGNAEVQTEEQIRRVLAEVSSGATIGIGSPRASNEANFALRCLVGDENFYSGMSDPEHVLSQLVLDLNSDTSFHTPSVREIERADAIIVLGEDVTNIAPRIALGLRQSVRNKALELAEDSNIPAWQDSAVRELAQHDRSPLCILSSYASRLDDIASDSLIDSSAALANVAYAIANKIDDSAPTSINVAAEYNEVIDRVAKQLSVAKNPLVIAGTSSNNADLIKAGANIARALAKENGTNLCLLLPEVNSLGVSLLSGVKNRLSSAFERIKNGSVSSAIIVENDLYRRASHDEVDSALDKLSNLVVIDQLPNATTAKAHYLLPSTAFSEHEATFVNYEGRAQLSFQVHRNQSNAQSAWRWLSDTEDCDVDALVNRCAVEAKGFDKLGNLLPDPEEFIAGMKVPRQSHRYSGRTAMKANLNVHEPKQAVDSESVMSFSMEGIPSQKDASILASSWSPQWNSNQSISKFQEEVNGELKQGHTGSLLIVRSDTAGDYFSPPPPAALLSTNGLHLALAYQIFGSDELSAQSATVQERMTDAYVSIAPADAEVRGIKQGDMVQLGDSSGKAAACIRSRIKPGTIAVYCGDNQIDSHMLGENIEISKLKDSNVGDGKGLAGLIVSDLLEEEY
jgi:NADH-quinone oxidoreductase subunit G